MKKKYLFRLLASALFLFLANFSQAQLSSPDMSNDQSGMYGHWTIGCAMEKTSNSLSFSGICPTNTAEASSAEILTTDIIIDDKTVKIGANVAVAYLWNEMAHTIRFTHEKSEYTFKVLSVNLNDVLIWRGAKDNSTLVLQKNKE